MERSAVYESFSRVRLACVDNSKGKGRTPIYKSRYPINVEMVRLSSCILPRADTMPGCSCTGEVRLRPP